MNEQKRELMLKFAAENGGKWNSCYSYLVFNGECFCFEITGENAFCTRTEYLDFIDSLFIGAPEDAEYYAYPERESYSSGWYKNENDKWYFMLNDGVDDLWGADDTGTDGHLLIPRPRKQEAEQVEWMPEIGQECEWFLEGVSEKWNYGYFVGFDKEGDMVMQRESGLDGLNTTSWRHNYKFRPLKTEAEKERERLIEAAYDLWTNQFIVDGDARDVKKYISDLIDAGLIK